MILQAKARPVRIRIKSGGEEHSSFESLKRHFCVKDLLPSAKDGRLSRWLRQQGEDSVANCIDAQSNELPSTEDLTEQAYIKFVLAFFESDFKHSQISTKQGLLEQWNTTSYANCHECQNLAKEIADALAKEEKAREDEKMRSSYSLALQMYKNNNGSRSKIEWMDIFSGFESRRKEDADYYWLMYEITSIEKYLERSAQLGYEKAKAMLMPNKFEEVTMQDFLSFFYTFKDYDLQFNSYLKEAISSAKRIKVKKQKDQSIKNDIVSILEAWNKFDSYGRYFNDKWLSEIEILKPEASFLCGIFAEYWSEVAAKYYIPYINSFALCKMRFDFLVRHNNICTICARSESGLNRYINVSRLSGKTEVCYKNVANLVQFIILHIFDEYSYEIR